MDKVYVLSLTDVSDGISLVDIVQVYKDKDKAKKLFDELIKIYYENNDFTDYYVRKSDNEFIAIHKEENYNDYIEIHLIKTNIIK